MSRNKAKATSTCWETMRPSRSRRARTTEAARGARSWCRRVWSFSTCRASCAEGVATLRRLARMSRAVRRLWVMARRKAAIWATGGTDRKTGLWSTTSWNSRTSTRWSSSTT